MIQEISAEDLMKQCKKSIEIRYSDLSSLEKALNDLGIKEFENINNESIRITQENIKPTDLLISLRKKNIEIENIRTSEIDVENYYLSLIGKGGNN